MVGKPLPHESDVFLFLFWLGVVAVLFKLETVKQNCGPSQECWQGNNTSFPWILSQQYKVMTLDVSIFLSIAADS